MREAIYNGTEIIGLLREVDVKFSQGKNVGQICREIGIAEQTYCRWRKEYNTFRPHSSLNYRPPAPEAYLN
jgi:Transposase.